METKFYKWWKGHRRVVTFGGFLILFAWYISPVIQESSNKNRCIQISKKYLLSNVKTSNRTLNQLKEMGVSPKEFSEWQSYKDCNSNYDFTMEF